MIHPGVRPIVESGLSAGTIIGSPNSSSETALFTAPNALSPPVTFARAQVSTRATSTNGLTWEEFAADAPRYSGSARRLLIEGQRTNLIPNPRFEGATPGTLGSGGALPSGFNATGTAAWWTVVGVGTELGLPYMDVTCAPSGAGSTSIWFTATSGISLSGSAVYSTSIFARLLSGDMSTFSAFGFLRRTDSASALNGTAANLKLVTGSISRYVTSETTAADATSGRAGLVVTSSGAGSVTLRIYAPQVELGAFASNPILPSVGTPGASTRGADLVSTTLTSLGIGANGACTLLWSGVLPNASPAAGSFTLCQIDDGTTNNRIFLRDNAGTNFLLWRVTGGAAANAAAGSYTPGAPFRFGITIDGAGRAACTFNGGSVVVVTGAPLAGLATLRLGGGVAGSESMFGETREFIVIPGALADADLAAYVASLPLFP